MIMYMCIIPNVPRAAVAHRREVHDDIFDIREPHSHLFPGFGQHLSSCASRCVLGSFACMALLLQCVAAGPSVVAFALCGVMEQGMPHYCDCC